MAQAFRVLAVDDDPDVLGRVLESLKEYLPEVEVVGEQDFDAALGVLEREYFDAVILDVRVGDPKAEVEHAKEAGRVAFEAIQRRRFVPVIFHTGLPEAVQDLASVLVRVKAKGDHPKELPKEVESVLKSGIPQIARGVQDHVREIQRDYMWGFVAAHWERLADADARDIAHLIARRLALSFNGAGVDSILAGLPAATVAKAATPDGMIHPVRYYVMPPLEDNVHRMGDIYRSESSDYYVLLTPSCDLVATGGRAPKVDRVLVAWCSLVEKEPEYIAWVADPANNDLKAKFVSLVSNRRQKGQPERFHFLPESFSIPGLLVDFASVGSLMLSDLEKMARVASLDAPFSASVLTRFQRYIGRYGTHDLDMVEVLRRIADKKVKK